MSLRSIVAAAALLVGLLLAGQGLWIQAKAQLAQLLLEQAWQRSLADGRPHRPWPWADHWPVAELSFIEAEQSFIVLEGDSGAVLAFAPGHNPQSGLPGSTLSSVISGHRDTHFRLLKTLQPGQTVSLRSLQASRSYRISRRQIVDSRSHQLALQQNATLQLVTCWPFDALASNGPMRLVVEAEALPPT